MASRAQQGSRPTRSRSLWRGGPYRRLLCGQHCWGACSTSSPHGLPHVSSRQNTQPTSFPEYMLFCCHEGPGGLSLSLLSVLPTVFEEQVPYSSAAFKTIALPLAVHRINEIANPYVWVCANCLLPQLKPSTSGQHRSPISYHKGRCLTGAGAGRWTRKAADVTPRGPCCLREPRLLREPHLLHPSTERSVGCSQPRRAGRGQQEGGLRAATPGR